MSLAAPGRDKFFGGTRGIPPEWAAFVYFNRNTNNAPRCANLPPENSHFA